MTVSASAACALAELPQCTAVPRIAIVGCFSHPAASRRTHLIARALEHAGAEISVTRLEPEPLQEGVGKVGTSAGAPMFGTRVRRRIQAGWNGLDELSNAVKEGVDAIFNYSESWIYSAPVWRLAHRQGIRLIQDCVEWYEPVCFGGNALHPTMLDHRTKRERLAARADGITAITSGLVSLYSERGASTFLLPPLCDASEFEAIGGRDRDRGGVLEILVVASGKPADGDNLIRPIRFNVTVIGSSDPFAGHPFRSAGIHRVEINRMENLARRDYLQALAHADVFLLPRRGGLHSEASFPNRVPEFLAAGGLLLTSDVGDFPLYLRHGRSGLLCADGDIDAFASALGWISCHRDEARDIAENGRYSALRNFDYHIHGQSLLAFVLGKLA